MERRQLNRNLQVSSYDADLVVLVEPANALQLFFPPGFTAMFPLPAIGVVTKLDLQPDYKAAAFRLDYAGVRQIFPFSCISGQGLAELRTYLRRFGCELDGD